MLNLSLIVAFSVRKRFLGLKSAVMNVGYYGIYIDGERGRAWMSLVLHSFLLVQLQLREVAERCSWTPDNALRPCTGL